MKLEFIKAGEIVVFDKAYCDFKHLATLNERGVFWVTRAKDNIKYEIKKHKKRMAFLQNCCYTEIRKTKKELLINVYRTG